VYDLKIIDMPKFEQNIRTHNAGLEQVKVLYETKKNNYQHHHIEKKEDKEIMKEVINDIFDREINKKSIANINTKVKSFSVFTDDDTDDDDKRTNTTLEELVKVAFEKGIPQAINLSFKTSNAFLIDRLHDLLVDKFYEELTRREIIKK